MSLSSESRSGRGPLQFGQKVEFYQATVWYPDIPLLEQRSAEIATQGTFHHVIQQYEKLLTIDLPWYTSCMLITFGNIRLMNKGMQYCLELPWPLW